MVPVLFVRFVCRCFWIFSRKRKNGVNCSDELSSILRGSCFKDFDVHWSFKRADENS